MSIRELVTRNRSYRGYDRSRMVSREELLELVECARLCPSSVNKQPLKFRPVWEPDEVAAVQSLTGWAKGLPQLQLPHAGKEPTAFIVICQDKQIDSNLSRYQRDVGITAQTMLLAAVEKGLGGCILGTFAAGTLAQALHLPEQTSPLLVLAIGKPDEQIVLTEAKDGTAYYRDENDIHYVPKRSLEEIVL